MHLTVRNVVFGSAAALVSCAFASLTPTTAAAGPLSVAPVSKVAPAPLVETVQFSGRARGVHIRSHRYVGVRHSYPRHVRYGYRSHNFFPAAAFGLIAGAALGAATYGSYGYACDPYYDWSWSSCPTYPTVGYYPGYWGGGYAPAYWGGGYYPVYRHRRVVYRHVHRRPVVYARGYVVNRPFAPRVRHVNFGRRPVGVVRVRR